MPHGSDSWKVNMKTIYIYQPLIIGLEHFYFYFFLLLFSNNAPKLRVLCQNYMYCLFELTYEKKDIYFMVVT